MLFVVYAKDGHDFDALRRRMSVRSEHVALGDKAVESGEQLLGAALLKDNGDMCGSVMLVDFKNREALDEWLKVEPYVTGNVWQDIEIFPCAVGPSFQHVLKK